jgi:hypothetical protein
VDGRGYFAKGVQVNASFGFNLACLGVFVDSYAYSGLGED